MKTQIFNLRVWVVLVALILVSGAASAVNVVKNSGFEEGNLDYWNILTDGASYGGSGVSAYPNPVFAGVYSGYVWANSWGGNRYSYISPNITDLSCNYYGGLTNCSLDTYHIHSIKVSAYTTQATVNYAYCVINLKNVLGNTVSAYYLYGGVNMWNTTEVNFTTVEMDNTKSFTFYCYVRGTTYPASHHIYLDDVVIDVEASCNASSDCVDGYCSNVTKTCKPLIPAGSPSGLAVECSDINTCNTSCATNWSYYGVCISTIEDYYYNRINTLNSTVGVLQTNITTLSALIQNDSARITALNASLQTNLAALASVNATVVAHTANIASLNASIQSLNASINNLTAKDAALNASIQSLNASINNLTANNAVLNGSIQAVAGNLASVNASLASASAAVGVLQGNVSSIASAVSVNSANISSLSSAFSSLNGTVTLILENIADLQAVDSELNASISLLWLSVTSMNASVVQNTLDILDLQGNVSDLYAQVQSNLDSIAALNESLQADVAALAELTSAVTTNLNTILLLDSYASSSSMYYSSNFNKPWSGTGARMFDYDASDYPGVASGVVAMADVLCWTYQQHPEYWTNSYYIANIQNCAETPIDLINTVSSWYSVCQTFEGRCPIEECTYGYYLDFAGADDDYTVHTEYLPDFELLDTSVREGSGVKLDLGFYNVTDVVQTEDIINGVGCWNVSFVRIGSHSVAVAGVDYEAGFITISDPSLNRLWYGYPGYEVGNSRHDLYKLNEDLTLSPTGTFRLQGYPWASVPDDGVPFGEGSAESCSNVDAVSSTLYCGIPQKLPAVGDVYTEAEALVVLHPANESLLDVVALNHSFVDGDYVTFVLQVTNSLSSRVHDVVITDTLPSGFDFTDSVIDVNGVRCYLDTDTAGTCLDVPVVGSEFRSDFWNALVGDGDVLTVTYYIQPDTGVITFSLPSLQGHGSVIIMMQVVSHINSYELHNFNLVDVQGLDVYDTINSLSLEIQSLNASINTLIAEDISLNSSIALVANSLASVNASLGSAAGDILALQGNVSVLQGDVAANSANISSLGMSIAFLNGNLSIIFSDLLALNASIQSVNASVVQNQLAIIALQGNVSSLLSQIQSDRNNIALLNASLQADIAALASVNASVQSNSVLISFLNASIQQLNSSIQSLTAKNTALNASLQSDIAALASVNASLGSASAAISVLQGNVSALSSSISSNTANISSLGSAVDSLNVTIQFILENIADLEAVDIELQESINALAVSLAGLNSSYSVDSSGLLASLDVANGNVGVLRADVQTGAEYFIVLLLAVAAVIFVVVIFRLMQPHN